MSSAQCPLRISILGPALLFASIAPSAGCLAYNIASVPVKIAAKTVEVAGRTSVAVVETTGKVAISTVRATGSVASGGIDASARLARAGMVTFVEANGAIVRIPWSRGLTLYAASHAAKLNVARGALKIVRDGKAIPVGTRAAESSPLLQSGDVVRIEP